MASRWHKIATVGKWHQHLERHRATSHFFLISPIEASNSWKACIIEDVWSPKKSFSMCSPWYSTNLRGSERDHIFCSPHARIEVPRMPHGPDYWQNVLIIVPIICTALAAVCFALRIYSRLRVLHGLQSEDVLMGAGLVCTCGVATCIVYCKTALCPQSCRMADWPWLRDLAGCRGIGTGENISDFPVEQRRQLALVRVEQLAPVSKNSTDML